MREQPYFSGSLFNKLGHGKYLNAAERQRFIQASLCVPANIRMFCFTLLWSGARISEVFALTPGSIDVESGVVSIQTLKRRKRGIVRQVANRRPSSRVSSFPDRCPPRHYKGSVIFSRSLVGGFGG
jgi:integrase/recombinase XerD